MKEIDLTTKVSDLSLLLGIAYALCSNHQLSFNNDEKQSFKLLTDKINQLYYNKGKK